MCRERSQMRAVVHVGFVSGIIGRSDSKSNCHSGRHRGWFFLILASRSIMGTTCIGNDSITAL
ncbi:MAG: hypothetical protein ACI9NT_001676 [Bacteroidia bacterium]|jgi:hypothetical protein